MSSKKETRYLAYIKEVKDKLNKLKKEKNIHDPDIEEIYRQFRKDMAEEDEVWIHNEYGNDDWPIIQRHQRWKNQEEDDSGTEILILYKIIQFLESLKIKC